MKRLFVTAGALALLASSAIAADNEMYVTDQNGKMMVMGGANAEGTELLKGENNARPNDCPDGSYYASGTNMATACDESDASTYMMEAPAAGSMMANGKPYAEGTMMMTPQKK